jgi:hypothetical protein
MFVGECDAVCTPSFRLWINFCRLHKSADDLKSVSVPDMDYLVTRTWFSAVKPSLFVNRRMAFARDPVVLETVVAKFFWQWLVETALLTASLSRSGCFLRRRGH